MLFGVSESFLKTYLNEDEIETFEKWGTIREKRLLKNHTKWGERTKTAKMAKKNFMTA